MPTTKPVVDDTKVTEPGSKPLGTVAPVGTLGRVVVAAGGTDVLGAALLGAPQAARARHRSTPTAADGRSRHFPMDATLPAEEAAPQRRTSRERRVPAGR